MRSNPAPTDDSWAVQNTAANSKIATLIVVLLRIAILGVARKEEPGKKAGPVPSLKNLRFTHRFRNCQNYQIIFATCLF